jgi:hypothetical protein
LYQNRQTDYRVNFANGSNVSVEIKCCGQHIGEIKFKDGEEKKCPACGKKHQLRIDYNHFHMSQFSPD